MIVHKKHVEMLEPYIPELKRILGKDVSLVHLTMLEEAYKWGVDLKWQRINE